LISPVDKNQHLLYGKTSKILYKKRGIGRYKLVRVDWEVE